MVKMLRSYIPSFVGTVLIFLWCTVPSVQAAQTSFEIGSMGSDVIPHQIVRTASDKVYMFGYTGDFSTTIKAYWQTNTGLPTSATQFSSSQLTE